MSSNNYTKLNLVYITICFAITLETLETNVVCEQTYYNLLDALWALLVQPHCIRALQWLLIYHNDNYLEVVQSHLMLILDLYIMMQSRLAEDAMKAPFDLDKNHKPTNRKKEK